MSFICMRMKNDFHVKGWAPTLVLKQRPGGTRKWPIGKTITLIYTCITLFCTFLSRRCTTTTWKCLISRLVEDVNTRQRLSFSFPELWYNLLEFNSRKIWRIERRAGINAITFDVARTPFLSDVLLAVAVVVAFKLKSSLMAYTRRFRPKGYLSQASGIWNGRDFTKWIIWKLSWPSCKCDVTQKPPWSAPAKA